MANVEARKVLTGTNAKVFLDGEEIGTWTNLEATVEIDYEDVYVGFDKDRKATGWQGTGSLNMQVTNSMNVRMFNKLKANKDVRFTIEGEITNDATGETQSETLEGVSFDSIPLSTWEKGALVTSEMSFRFLPSKSQFPQLIS